MTNVLDTLLAVRARQTIIAFGAGTSASGTMVIAALTGFCLFIQTIALPKAVNTMEQTTKMGRVSTRLMAVMNAPARTAMLFAPKGHV